MNELFVRSKRNPILCPNPANWWEGRKIYNPGAIFHNGKYHLFYRAVGSGVDWQSVIGYAVSGDGENFQRFDQPLLSGFDEYEKRGLEDPRIVKIDDTFYMSYAAYDGLTPRLCVATSGDLKKWIKHGPVFSGWLFDKAGGVWTEFDKNSEHYNKKQINEWSKAGAIFPEKINGKFWMLFGEYQLWLATSEDGISWTGAQTPFLAPRAGAFFDNIFVEMGPPPIKTKKGWLILYHGINDKHCYRLGFLLLDLKDPRKIILRSEQPIFEPAKNYETGGLVDVLPGGLKAMQKMSEKELKNFLEKNNNKNRPRVIFCGGAILIKNILRIYYGAGDSIICTATADIDDILKT